MLILRHSSLLNQLLSKMLHWLKTKKKKKYCLEAQKLALLKNLFLELVL